MAAEAAWTCGVSHCFAMHLDGCGEVFGSLPVRAGKPVRLREMRRESESYAGAPRPKSIKRGEPCPPETA